MSPSYDNFEWYVSTELRYVNLAGPFHLNPRGIRNVINLDYQRFEDLLPNARYLITK